MAAVAGVKVIVVVPVEGVALGKCVTAVARVLVDVVVVVLLLVVLEAVVFVKAVLEWVVVSVVSVTSMTNYQKQEFLE